MRRPYLLLVLWLSTSVPVVATAQKGYALGIGGGAAIPVGKLGDVQNTGYSAMVTLALGSPDFPIGVRIDGIYNSLTHTTPPTASGAPTPGDLRVAGALLNLVYAFPGTYAKPY